MLKSIVTVQCIDVKAVVGGPAGAAMAAIGRTTFLPKMVLARQHFWPNMFFAGPFSHVSPRPS